MAAIIRVLSVDGAFKAEYESGTVRRYKAGSLPGTVRTWIMENDPGLLAVPAEPEPDPIVPVPIGPEAVQAEATSLVVIDNEPAMEPEPEPEPVGLATAFQEPEEEAAWEPAEPDADPVGDAVRMLSKALQALFGAAGEEAITVMVAAEMAMEAVAPVAAGAAGKAARAAGKAARAAGQAGRAIAPKAAAIGMALLLWLADLAMAMAFWIPEVLRRAGFVVAWRFFPAAADGAKAGWKEARKAGATGKAWASEAAAWTEETVRSGWELRKEIITEDKEAA